MEIIEKLQQSKTAFNNLIAARAGLLFYKPQPEKWNIAEISEHLVLSEKSGYLAMLKTGPAPDNELLESMEKKFRILAESNQPIVAPEAAHPRGKYTTLEELLKDFNGIRDRIINLVHEADLNLLALGFEHPRLGYLTRNQWLKFILWHTEHHSKQIELLGV